MKRVAVVLAILSSLLVFSVVGEACTLFAAAGDRVAGGGTIIVKNRDWKPDHHQVLKLVTPVNGYRYYGIFAIGNDSPGVKAGINEHGLVVVSATASSIPKTA